MATTPDTPSTDLAADIEKAVKAEVADMNAKRPRPPMRFATPPEEPPPTLAQTPTLAETLPAPHEPTEPVPLPVVLAALGGALDELDRRTDARLARIERALGITP